MQILLKDIKDEGTELGFELEPETFNSRVENTRDELISFGGGVAFKGSISRQGGTVHLLGELSADYDAECARCAVSTGASLSQQVECRLKPRSGDSEIETGEFEDLNLSYYSGIRINLAPLLEDQLMLALPMQVFCKDECLGLCSSCGVNLNSASCACQAVSKESDQTKTQRPFANLAELISES